MNPDELETQPLAGQNFASSVKSTLVLLPDPGHLDNCDTLEGLMNGERPLVDYRDQYRAQFKARLRAKSVAGLLGNLFDFLLCPTWWLVVWIGWLRV